MITNTTNRQNTIEQFYDDLRNKNKVSLKHLKSHGVTLPYNIYYVDETCAYIEIAVAGYKKEDIYVSKKLDVLSITTTYQSIGNGSEVPDNENIQYKIEPPTDDDTSLGNKFYVYKGLTNKEFTMNFHVPYGHKIGCISMDNGVLSIYIILTEDLWTKSERLF